MVSNTKSLPLNTNNTAKKRPSGLSFGIIYLGFLAGAMPIVSAIRGIINSNSTSGIPISFYFLKAFTFVVCSSIITGAVLAWKGNNRGRYLLLVSQTFYYASMLLTYLYAIQINAVDDSLALRWVLRSSIVPVFAWVYFHTKPVSEYYAQVRQDNIDISMKKSTPFDESKSSNKSAHAKKKSTVKSTKNTRKTK